MAQHIARTAAFVCFMALLFVAGYAIHEQDTRMAPEPEFDEGLPPSELLSSSPRRVEVGGRTYQVAWNDSLVTVKDERTQIQIAKLQTGSRAPDALPIMDVTVDSAGTVTVVCLQKKWVHERLIARAWQHVEASL